LALASLGCLLLWAAFAPLGWSPLAWVAPLPWLALVSQPQLKGRRPYVQIWLAGTLFWIAMLHWLRFPHWGTAIGWFVLSGYLGLYLPLFVGLSRVALWQYRWPLYVAAPVVWASLELARGYLLTGFGLAMLAHTQAAWLPLVQSADLLGAYGLSAAMMCISACLFVAVSQRRWQSLVPAIVLLLAVWGYGTWRLSQQPEGRSIQVGLIQGSVPTEVKVDPNLRNVVFREYYGLSRQAMKDHPDLEVLVWPETMFREPLFTYSDDVAPPPGADWTVEDLERTAQRNLDFVAETARSLNVPLVLGLDVLHYGPGTTEHFNSAIFVDRDGTIQGRYDKHHPVMFGEYIPFAKWLPFLYQWTPLAAGVEAGTRDEAFQIGSTRWGADICYETIMPQVIRQQVRRHARSEAGIDVLVNLTNSGYYHGASELDLHLACAVFRAVENRRPLLIAANEGISAHINGDGHILARGPKQDQAILATAVETDGRDSLYQQLGDLPVAVMLVVTVGLAVGGWRRQRIEPVRQPANRA
jgi:apolipoprotein N-acyltransferase